MPRPPNTTLQEALKSSLSRSPRAGQLDVSTEALEGTRSRLVALAPGEPSELYLRYCRNFPDNEALRQWGGIFMIVQTRSHIRRFHHPTLQIDRINPDPFCPSNYPNPSSSTVLRNSIHSQEKRISSEVTAPHRVRNRLSQYPPVF